MKKLASYVVFSATVGVSSIMGVGCRSFNTPTESSESLAAPQSTNRDDYIKAFNQKIQALTPIEEQAIMAATIGSVYKDFKKKLDNGEIAALGINVDRAKAAIKKYPKEFDELMNSTVTLADLASANKIKSLKEIKLSAAWSSDLDAFPNEQMWPTNTTTSIPKTSVIDKSGTDSEGLQLIGAAGAVVSTVRVLTCGTALISGIVTIPLFTTTILTLDKIWGPIGGPKDPVSWLLAGVTSALANSSIIIAKYSCE